MYYRDQEELMLRVTGIAAAVALGVVLTAGTASAQGSADKGKQVFTAQKCAMCHSIGDTGNKKGPLDDVGSKLKAEDIRQWLLAPAVQAEKAKATRKPAMPSYASKLSKDELDSLVSYLETLKKK
jgi:mono/diheme cytochrome c family protein